MITKDKKCSGCKEIKLTNEFDKNRATKSGFAPECKECRKERNKKGYLAAIAFFDEIRVGEEGNSDTAIRYATTDRWADTMLYLIDNISKNPETGCYLWEITTDADGYGRAHIPLPTTPYYSTPVVAHRLSFASSYGFDVLPLGLTGGDNDGSKDTLDHICGVRACVNASHLQVITASLNASMGGKERVAPKGYGRIIDASFASPSLIAAIENAGVDE